MPSESLKLTACIHAHSVSVKCDANLGKVEICPLETDDNSYLLSVTPASTLPLGSFDFSFSIFVKDEFGHVLATVPIRSHGTIVDEVFAVPDNIHYGVVKQNDTVTQKMQLHSLIDTSFEITSVTVSHPSIEVVCHNKSESRCSELMVTAKFSQVQQYK